MIGPDEYITRMDRSRIVPQKAPVNPDDIITLATQFAEVQCAVSHFMNGDLTWDKAMMLAVKLLCHTLERESKIEWTNSTPTPFTAK